MLLTLLLVATMPVAQAESLGDIAAGLSAAAPYKARAQYEVLLPQSENPVIYEIALMAGKAGNSDTLAPCSYLIDWRMDTPSGESSGFNAYFDGHHYRFRDKRLQEYHYDDCADSFSTHGNLRLGVQQQAQFTSLLPAFIAEKLREIEQDTCYIYTVNRSDATGTVSVEGSQRRHGCEGMTFKYVFDNATGLPVAADFCLNPGQISEQNVNVTYNRADSLPAAVQLSEPVLMSLYPDAFGKYRESSYTFAGLPGRPLPSFTAPAIDGSRYSYRIGRQFPNPVLIAILDTGESSCTEYVEALREAAEMAPASSTLILAFTSGSPDAIAATIARQRPGEIILSGAKGLARSCGATATPALLVCRRDGTIQNVYAGRNKGLRTIVIQEISIANQL